MCNLQAGERPVFKTLHLLLNNSFFQGFDESNTPNKIFSSPKAGIQGGLRLFLFSGAARVPSKIFF